MMQQPLHPETLTWTALLGRWIEFAQASMALPADGQGERWRESVSCVINLQAVTFALADLHTLSVVDRPVALDRAEVLIDDNERKLGAIWAEELPGSLLEIIGDAHGSLTLARAICDDTD